MEPKYFKSLRNNIVYYVDEIGNMRIATDDEIKNNYIIQPKIINGPMPVIRDIYKFENNQLKLKNMKLVQEAIDNNWNDRIWYHYTELVDYNAVRPQCTECAQWEIVIEKLQLKVNTLSKNAKECVDKFIVKEKDNG